MRSPGSGVSVQRQNTSQSVVRCVEEYLSRSSFLDVNLRKERKTWITLGKKILRISDVS